MPTYTQRVTAVSSFEQMLFTSATSLTLALLDFIALRELHVLSKLNKRMGFVVRYYTDKKWKVSDFLTHFFDNPLEILQFMEEENAILFGSAVFQFLDRTFGPHCTLLDICIHVESSEKINHIMERAAYKFKNSACVAGTFLTAIKDKIVTTPPHKLKSSGERNSAESDRSPWGPYDFGGTDQKSKLRIRIHVVRCDPFRHITTLQSSALMNYISWNCVVSLFPNSAFIRRRSFVSRQEDLPWRSAPEGLHAWFENYAKKTKINIIGITHRRYKEVETGERYVGDKLCWIIPVVQSGHQVLDHVLNIMSLDTYSAITIAEQDNTNLEANVIPDICGSARCTVPKDNQILKRCAGCQAKYYCCRACQIVDWPIHQILCDRKAAERPTPGWEEAILQFYDTYGVFILSYGIGLVFAISELNPGYLPTPTEWRSVWSTYACAIEIKVTEVPNSTGVSAYTVKFFRTFPVRVDTYLSLSRLRGYWNSVSRTDYAIGVLFVVVPYERGPVQAITTTTRLLDISEVATPATYMANSRGAIKDVIDDLAA
ncbi:hypothetical protein CVT26_005517 [Gymnopilus dilepis]|uniref:MYND-type domain-containing protein n=1 Tax=Gymnopilus dilepis TaxID=231916 RepID=A0A409W829_9AGAR|nr:hypothetical protein CVT26_005517 [Gymnopilus dilepis]